MGVYGPASQPPIGVNTAILAIGDSWFWYPTQQNILNSLAAFPQMRPEYADIFRLGNNGATLLEYVDLPNSPGKYAADLALQLQPNFITPYSVLLVSGGGNDAVDYGLCLNPDCSAATNASDCVNPAGLQNLLKNLTMYMSMVIHEAAWAFQQAGKKLTVILHGYDYGVPDGRGFALIPGITLTGPWLKPAMDHRLVPPDMDLRKEIVRTLIGALGAAFRQYHDPSANIYYVDSAGTLSQGPDYMNDWANELHPTTSGFNKIVAEKWYPVLQQLGMAV